MIDSLQMMQQMFFVGYLNNKQIQILKLMLLMGIFKSTLALFKKAIERKIDEPKGRLTRLIKFTKGEAKELT